MSNNENQLSSASSTGGLGNNFENRVQASFVVLMLADSFAPCLPLWPINKIKFQGKYQGYDTDDLIVFAKEDSNKVVKLIGQIKHSIKINNSNKEFKKVIQSAWKDFNNKDIFTEGKDIIALICGPLSATDTDGVRAMLRQADHATDSEDFVRRIGLAKFTGETQRVKLKVFKTALKIANNNIDLTEEQLWRFLKSFRLLIYDLDMKGVTLSLLHSLIGQCSEGNADALWTQLKDMAEWTNESAGTITLDSIPDDIKSRFAKQPKEVIPSSLTKKTSHVGTVDWNHAQYASELAVVNLLGGWSEKFDADKDVVGRIAKEDFSVWISKMREIIQQSDSPIALKNGIWTVTERQKLWQMLGSRLYDDHLDIFERCAVNVLVERDPRFDLDPNERYAANIYGKVLKHSHFIREGLAESLALLGSHSDVLNNCSSNKPETIAVLVVRKIFESADWVLWGSLNNLLPLLAEAAPHEFLEAVEAEASKKPCSFDELFAQEGSGIMGGNYLTGLLWALEGLAWDEQYLSRVSVILGELASHDPGGNWGNRPANSLSTIFLPWLPQTTATSEKRKVALKTLQKESPEEAWKLFLSLLPNQHQISSGSHKPCWRKTIPEDWDKTVSYKDYWEQVSCCAGMAVEMAKNDIVRLKELVGHLDHLTPELFDAMLEHLASDEIINKPENELLNLWEELVEFIAKHKKYSDADWAMNPEIILKIEVVAEKLAPKNPLYLYHMLFSGRDFDLYEEKGDWQEQQKKLEEQRIRAIKEIIQFGGMDAVIRFAKAVEFPANVGQSLGAIAETEVDSVVLPDLLEIDDQALSQFLGGFVWAKYWRKGWDWVDKLNIDTWSPSKIGQFLSCLPFISGTGKRAERLLGKLESEYWSRANVNPYQEKDDINWAIEKLIKYNRPNSAINCLSRTKYHKQPVDKALAAKALLAAVSTNEPFNSMHTHDFIELIKVLQNDPDTNPDDLFHVEWSYLPLLDRHRGASPKLLEKRLASDYKFFCELIRLVYRSEKKDKSRDEPTERQQVIATNTYRLLREWRIPPGLQPDGKFLGDHFKKWFDLVKKDCVESGHLDVALSAIGQVLIYSPSDPDGLWINKTVADTLNSKDAEVMRSGYRSGIYNSRGVHWVNPTGKPELELSAKYEQQAEEVENAGYQRFAATLRGLADSYSKEAKRIIEEHKKEKTDEE